MYITSASILLLLCCREKQELIAAAMPRPDAAGDPCMSAAVTTVEEIVKRVEELAQGLH
jgi:hypothetical protein